MIRRALVFAIAGTLTFTLSTLDARAVSIPATVQGLIRIEPISGFVAGPNPDYIEIFHQNTDDSRGIVEFNISSLTAPVSSAQIFLTRASVGFGTFPPKTFNALGYVGNGTLELADYSAGTTASPFLYGGELTASVDVTTFVNSLVGSTTFVGFTLLKDSEPAFVGARFNQISLGQPFASLEVDPAGPVPEPIPEPATLVLLGSTFAAVGVARWRQRRRQQS